MGWIVCVVLIVSMIVSGIFDSSILIAAGLFAIAGAISFASAKK